VLQLLDVNADGLEELVVVAASAQFHDLVGEDADIDDAQQTLLPVDHGDGEELVEDEALARLEQGGSLGKREDPRHHHLADPALQRFGEETPGGNDAGEPALAVDDIEIEDALLEATRRLEMIEAEVMRLQERLAI
jgi:hypothetical protein